MRECPDPDVLLIPGGVGVQALLGRPEFMESVREIASRSQLVTSVCTGSLVLGKLGLLDGLDSTTHHGCFGQLRDVAPRSRVLTNQRFVDTGRVITSAGISAGIDMSLHVVDRLLGNDLARSVAKRMEYHRSPEGTPNSQHQNELGQPVGFPIDEWNAAANPPRTAMAGRSCRLEPLDPSRHAQQLYESISASPDEGNWTYLPYGPMSTFEEFNHWLTSGMRAGRSTLLRHPGFVRFRERSGDGYRELPADRTQHRQHRSGAPSLFTAASAHGCSDRSDVPDDDARF